MKQIATLEEFAQDIETGKHVFFFTAGWCGDCRFIKPAMPEIEEVFPDYQFDEVDRDQFIEICQKWDIMGIPSFVVIENGQEKGRLVNKKRKTKEEITTFLSSVIK